MKVAESTKWARQNPERHRANVRRWREENPDKVLELNRRRREKGIGRQYALRTRYGISEDDREQMLDKQGRSCAICKSLTPGSRYYWAIDHSHKTGRVRGILCHSCNVALGFAKENVATLKSMILYLEQNQ